MKRVILLVCLFLTAGCGPSRVNQIQVAERVTVQPSSAFQWPLKKARILSRFGKRGKRFHTGIDIQKSRRGKDKVLASRTGKVVEAQKRRGYGNVITIRHPDGYKTRYAHLGSFLVRNGQQVGAEQAIGLVGRSGRATTPHLHFEIVTPNGLFIDPLLLLK